MVVLAVMLAAICIMTTVVAQRPMGMTLLDVPHFSWSMLVAGAIWLLSFPVWLANMAVIWVDFDGENAVRFGRVDNIWAQLDWLFRQPMVFAFAIPVLGIMADMVASSSGVRQRGYGVIQGAIAAMGALTFGAFIQPFFAPDSDNQAVFTVMTLLLALPVLAVLGGLADTVRRGKLKANGPLAMGFMAVQVLMAGITAAVLVAAGAALGIVREIDEDWLSGVLRWLDDLDGTVILTSVTYLALLAAVTGAVAGLYYWAPKMFGRQLSPAMGGLAGLSLMGGALLIGGANLVNGILDEPENHFQLIAAETPRLGDIWDVSTVETINWIGAVGALAVAGGLLLVFMDFGRSVALGKGDNENADDPWNGQTLEWATDSPPPLGNFPEAPVVTTPQPLLDAKEDQ